MQKENTFSFSIFVPVNCNYDFILNFGIYFFLHCMCDGNKFFAKKKKIKIENYVKKNVLGN